MSEPTHDPRRTDDQGPLRVAVIGFGMAGAVFHAPLIHATTGLEVAAIVTGNTERSATARARYPDAIVAPDVEALWAMADRLDVAVVATPNRTHIPLASAALAAGLHVIVDKPLAATADGARRLVEDARRHDRLLTVFQNRRWDGDLLTLRRLVDEGALGEVHRLESRFERWRPVPKPGWRQDPDPEEAGGLLFDLGAHLIDQALLLFGPIAHLHAELDRRRAGVDDDVFLALTHESGVRSHLWMNTISARPGPRFRVLGSRGSWVKRGLDVQEARLKEGRDPREPGFGLAPEDQWGVLYDGDQAHRVRPEPGAYGSFYAELVRSVRTGGTPPVESADAVAVLEIIEAARSYAG